MQLPTVRDGAPVDRRRFLREGAGVVAALSVPALVGCGGSSTARASRAAPRVAGSGDTDTVIFDVRRSSPPNAAAWRTLSRSLSGRLVLPADRAYAASKKLFDPRFDTARPAAIAYCASPLDVQRTVDFARAHGIRPIPRGGGHSYGGYSTGSGLVIDVTRMHTVKVTKARKGAPATAHVGAGTRLIDLYDGLSRAGVLVPGGSCPTVGISGLALGGGIGVLARKYGLTCDAIRSLKIVTADGRLLTCDGGSQPDLYWASRGGGGGNFGVVTSFTFTAHPIPELTLFTVDWPWAAATEALGGWIRWLHQAPDELWSNFQLLSAGSSGLVVRSSGVFVGGKSALTSLVNRLVSTVGSTPSSTFVGDPDPYLHVMLVEAGCDSGSVAECHLPSQNRAGTLQRSAYAAKSDYVGKPLPSAGLAAAANAVAHLHAEHPGLGGGLAFDAYGGAVNRVRADATAFVHRSAICAIQATVTWGSAPSGPAFAAGEGWLASAGKALAPYTTGGAYQNYIDPRLADWQRAYYGSNLRRLSSVKRKYDPDDAFHFAQSIPLHA
ncbi:MAG TPA: FAD-dependent oxidoreductase [Solirubrobacteraceae bacterium]